MGSDVAQIVVGLCDVGVVRGAVPIDDCQFEASRIGDVLGMFQ